MGMFPTKRTARGVRRQPGEMNRTEKAYAAHLELLRRAGDVLWFEFDAVKLRLADKTFYTPDFLVMRADDTLEVHEVKGFWEDDARVKIKVAASLFPFKFLAIKKDKAGWAVEAF